MDSNYVSTSKDHPKEVETIASSGDTMDVSTPNHAALELTIDKSGQSGSTSMSLSTVLRDTLQDCLDATIHFENLSPNIIQSIAMREVESCREIFESSGVSLVIDDTVYDAIFGNLQQASSPVNGHQARSTARAKILDPAFSELNACLASAETQIANTRKRIIVRPSGLSCVADLE
jgi:ATP-dependent Clp protease ATP-binding subunit ClpA